ncbi:hypothetical protein HMPREF9248_0356 [Fannyhessea vaginae PB189-T1-4]|jgi:hypothetical protein|uniref:Uncharacterized protein n=1 Tax=Fannyhessea vaginae PB189-T1-4 TaxID=866774 RepID=A0ABN0AZI8_9ACTN|nr:DUF6724 family protein [Fannyhessea vaginae]EFL43991.1 hypothetical protein HMPREF9248_0356 [Fannyhessea vaginae PB189-T1-4]
MDTVAQLFEQLGQFFNWLFGTRLGVMWLVIGGILFFVVIAIVLEIKTRKRYKNHAKQEGDFDLFDSDDESGWSDFEEDNK